MGWACGMYGEKRNRDRRIYLLSAIGLTPGGSNTVHIYTQTIHRTCGVMLGKSDNKRRKRRWKDNIKVVLK
jgi:hypothetical protein